MNIVQKISILFLVMVTFVSYAQENQIGNQISPSNKHFLKTSCESCFTATKNMPLAIEQANQLEKKYYAQYQVGILKTELTARSVKAIKDIPFSVFKRTPLIGILNTGLDFVIDDTKRVAQQNKKREFYKKIDQNLAIYLKNELVTSEKEISNTVLVQGFLDYLKASNLNPSDYGVYGKKVDLFLLDYLQKNEGAISQLKEEITTEIAQLKQDVSFDVDTYKKQLSAEFTTSSDELKTTISEVNTIVLDNLNAVHEIAGSLKRFEEKVAEKFSVVAKDVEEMQTEIARNDKRIKENEKFIQNNSSKIKEIGIKQRENRELISQNAYKIDVMQGVLYQNVNTQGKLKLLEITRFYDDPVANQKFITKEKSRLKNIATIEGLQNGLEYGTELVTLASNLGVSQKDLKNVSKAIEIGNVVLQGAMAYVTGNPLQGLQALNGAFGLFGGGGSSPDPRFEQILQQLEVITQQIEVLDKKIDALDKKVTKLYELNIALHKDTVTRFNRLEYKLDNLSDQVDYVIKVLTSECASLSFDPNDHATLWRNIEKAENLDFLNVQHEIYPILGDVLSCVRKNVNVKDISSRTFLHYNRIDNKNNWETNILKPTLELTTNFYNSPKKETRLVAASKYSHLRTTDFSKILLESESFLKDTKYYIDYDVADLRILIHPKSILQLAKLLHLLEPYFYYGKTSEGFQIYKLDRLKQLANQGFFEGRSETLRAWYKTLLRDCEIAISQQNILSGGLLLPLLYKELSNSGNVNPQTEKVYRLLNSENYYLKTNLATYILYNEIGGNAQLLKLLGNSFYRSKKEAQSTVDQINSMLNGNTYQLEIYEEYGTYYPMLKIQTPVKEGAGTFPQRLLLPIQTIDVIAENKMVYPKVLDELHTAKEFISNHIVEHDMMVKANTETYEEFKKLLNQN